MCTCFSAGMVSNQRNYDYMYTCALIHLDCADKSTVSEVYA